ncbi:tubulin-tyrosine ligase [Thecamonas trahens ATCC 50062]|uniref:Tubulin--tyrosine ligase-like protein 5 n=1 Tax=Thecamonas trahens ATCC 50062 TaxID=461836 RepID=A0A0L0D710_THETB|nr:tubulin-tyrosine ligase [Thecamonas trahens ATCC 50062]KNC48162.1 tubulin-tyrosine ligase [Thecamonas trahens ATCC 50062]|eukprot:XP_013758732.1 tubulin-tyrosine ligase [Thecamonas trahens ATCC 50062]
MAVEKVPCLRTVLALTLLVAAGVAVVVAAGEASEVDAEARKALAKRFPLPWKVSRSVTVFYGDFRDGGLWDSEAAGCKAAGAAPEDHPLMLRVCAEGDGKSEEQSGQARRMKMRSNGWLVLQILKERGLSMRMASPWGRLFWVRVGLPGVPTGDWPLLGYGELGPHQLVNRIPGMSTLLNKKDAFARSVAAKRAAFPDGGFDFHPVSYVLPADSAALAKAAAAVVASGGDQRFIIKPVCGGRGQDISVVAAEDVVAAAPANGEWLVQDYIGNPLLVDGHKFSIRLYLLVTSVNPLRVFVAREGIVKFAGIPWSASRAANALDPANINIHITNNAANAHTPGFESSDSPEVDDVGLRRSISAIRRQLADAGHDDAAIFAAIDDVLLKAVLAVEDEVSGLIDAYVPYPNNTFQLLGVDVDLDANLKPWVIELNVNPSLGSHAAFETPHKKELLHTVLDMAGATPFDAAAFKAEVIAPRVHAASCSGQPEPGLPQQTWCDERVFAAVVDFEYELAMARGFDPLFPRAHNGRTMAGYMTTLKDADAALLDYVLFKSARPPPPSPPFHLHTEL